MNKIKIIESIDSNIFEHQPKLIKLKLEVQTISCVKMCELKIGKIKTVITKNQIFVNFERTFRTNF